METFTVNITEKYSHDFEVEASSREEAESIATDKYESNEFLVNDGTDFIGADIEVIAG